MIDRDFWTGKRVVITGHTGFKGSWLTLWLNLLGAKITGYALSPTEQQPLYNQLSLSSCISDHRSDINNLDHLGKVLSEAEPQILIHLAAQSLVRESYKNPFNTFATNVMGTVNVLEVARSTPSVRVILVITSDKCYENIERQYLYKESDRFGGLDPYSSSKGCAELVTQAYRHSFFDNRSNPHIGIATARAGNVIGGGDWADDRLVPDAIRAFSSGEELQVRFPNATRPWQHVFDALYGYLLLCEGLWKDPRGFSGGWNFGPEAHGIVSVGTISDLLARSYGSDAAWSSFEEQDNPHEATLLQLDITKAVSQLGWRPRWDLEIAIDRTVSWYKSLNSGEDMKAISTQQIFEYEDARASNLP